MKPIALTGDRPTGPLHLGHYVGSLRARLTLQLSHTLFIMIADGQALTDNFDDPGKVHRAVMEVLKDYIAVGLDPNVCTPFLQSHVPELTELMFYYLNLVTLPRLMRNPTVKAEMQLRGFHQANPEVDPTCQDQGVPMGFLCYPVSQAADITAFGHPQAHTIIVPVGDDQLPMIEQTNEIVRKFNRIYGENVLQEAQALLSNTPRLVGIDGQAKASKSLGNAIFLSDDAPTVKAKVFQMYTDPDHIRVSDPGKVEGNVVFAYLDAFHPDPNEVASLKAHYRRGGLGDVTLKQILVRALEDLLAPIRARRQDLREEDLRAILYHGSQRARIQAQATLDRVRKAMQLWPMPDIAAFV